MHNKRRSSLILLFEEACCRRAHRGEETRVFRHTQQGITSSRQTTASIAVRISIEVQQRLRNWPARLNIIAAPWDAALTENG